MDDPNKNVSGLGKAIADVKSDLKSGENIDAYIAIAVAVIIFLVGLFGPIVPGLSSITGQITNALTPVLFTTIAFAILRNRHHTEAIQHKAEQLHEEIQESTGQFAQLFPRLEQLTKSKEDFERAGVNAIHSRMPIERLSKTVASSRRRVCLLSTWFSDMLVVSECLIGASRNGCEIKILLLDPDSQSAKQRGLDLNNHRDGSANYVSDRIHLSIVELQKLGREKNVKMEIKVYDSLPSAQIYICDDQAFVGFFWHSDRSTRGPQIELSDVSNSEFGVWISQEFDRIWTSQKTRSIPNS